MRNAMAASKRGYRVRTTLSTGIEQPPNELTTDVDEELAAAASRWTLDDFPVILPPPGFSDLSTESAIEYLAGPGTVPRPPKGRAQFDRSVHKLFAGDSVPWLGQRCSGHTIMQERHGYR